MKGKPPWCLFETYHMFATSWVPSKEQVVPFLMILVCRSPGSNPQIPISQSGHSTDWATTAESSSYGKSDCIP